MTTSSVDLFLVNYNAGHLLDESLAAIGASKGVNVSVHVYDNASKDGSAQSLASKGLATHLLGETNLGYNGALRRLLEATSGGAAWVAFIAPDVRVRPDALAKMVETAQTDERIGLVAGVALAPNGSVESAGIGYSKSGLAYVRKQREDSGDLLAPNGGFLLARREALEAIGIDDRLFLYYEEIALGLGALSAGWRVALCPEAEATHDAGGVMRRYPSRKARHLSLSRRMTIFLYWPWSWILKRFPLIIAVESVSVLRSIARGEALAHLAGWRDFFKALAAFPARKPVPRDLPVPWGRAIGRRG